jgi:hypothetical protein
MELAAPLRKRLVDGDEDITIMFMNRRLSFKDKVVWDKALAMQAVCKTPTLYRHLPEFLKRDDIIDVSSHAEFQQ